MHMQVLFFLCNVVSGVLQRLVQVKALGFAVQKKVRFKITFNSIKYYLTLHSLCNGVGHLGPGKCDLQHCGLPHFGWKPVHKAYTQSKALNPKP